MEISKRKKLIHYFYKHQSEILSSKDIRNQFPYVVKLGWMILVGDLSYVRIGTSVCFYSYNNELVLGIYNNLLKFKSIPISIKKRLPSVYFVHSLINKNPSRIFSYQDIVECLRNDYHINAHQSSIAAALHLNCCSLKVGKNALYGSKKVILNKEKELKQLKVPYSIRVIPRDFKIEYKERTRAYA